ncbi:centromere protein R isoform X2 [Hoplias malabaricus]|uniref:centromere protein R isoform X2 n=1 Tax=Hoplias malabaricus TaxID=27720 RepID=UPI0034634ECA
MPVKRTLQLEDKENTPIKRQALERIYSPLTGTMPMSPAARTQGNAKTSGKTFNNSSAKEPQTEEERMLFFRSKLEGSIAALMKTRKQLESLVPIEGSSELRSFLLMSPADLQSELKRHKELTSKVADCINEAQRHESCLQGTTQTGSSYDFLKEILSG